MYGILAYADPDCKVDSPGFFIDFSDANNIDFLTKTTGYSSEYLTGSDKIVKPTTTTTSKIATTTTTTTTLATSSQTVTEKVSTTTKATIFPPNIFTTIIPVTQKSCVETFNDFKGRDYEGCQTKTISGRTCQSWFAQFPHKHDMNLDRLKLRGITQNEPNYCRNPNESDIGIWCYTTDPNVRFERCEPVDTNVISTTTPVTEFVTENCIENFNDSKGRDYEGCQDRTVSGKLCQKWALQSPHSHNIDLTRLRNMPSNANFCRNPDERDEGIWCFTTDPDIVSEKCVPRGLSTTTEITSTQPVNCIETFNDSKGRDYEGCQDRTVSGKLCQKWVSQSPHQHEIALERLRNMPSDGNFCRNPDERDEGIWCFTTDPNVVSEKCVPRGSTTTTTTELLTTVEPSNEDDYDNWSKNQLIARIIDLKAAIEKIISDYFE